MSIGLPAILQLAIGGATTISTIRSGKKIQKAQKESNAISTASETFRNRLARRQTAKITRLRRARIIASSAATGTAGSSGELGAISALGASAGGSLGQQQADILAAKGLTRTSQQAANAESSALRAQAFGRLALNSIDLLDKEGFFS